MATVKKVEDMKRICSRCTNETEKNRCSAGHIRWRDGYTLKIKPVHNCPNYKRKNGNKT
jgi:hypothetical protein